MLSVEDDEIPGGSGYKDITLTLPGLASDISHDGMVAMKNFTLHDAMMAIEVMDPRMDSGVARPEYAKGVFDPYASLLPEEVCWIIDRTFAAEMAWYSGQSLSQSVFTCLYVHEIVPGRMWYGNRSAFGFAMNGGDPKRPVQLLALVLKAAIYGLLKSCDLAWRELTKGYVNEMEDFNGEKSDRFLCETISEIEILGLLDSAKLWLLSKQAASITMRPELIARIDLRRAMLTILSPSAAITELGPVLRVAQSHLRDLRSLTIPPEPDNTSPAYQAFDPSIARRLLSVMPLKITPLPDQVNVWGDYSLLLESIQEVCLLTKCPSILQVKELLELRVYQPPLANRVGLVRSLAHTALLAAKGHSWSDRIFEAMAGVDLTVLLSSMPLVLVQQTPLSLKASIDKMTQEYFASFFSNRPRQRRKLCNWMGDWAQLPFQLQDLMKSSSEDPEKLRLCHRLFLAVCILRFEGASNIVLSGLELDIHDANELPFVLWHGAMIYNNLNAALKVLKGESELAPPAIMDYIFYGMMWSSLMSQYLTACCTASLLLKRIPDASIVREKTNFDRRFKWALGLNSGDTSSLPVDPCTPRFEDWTAFRDLQRQETTWKQAQTCGSVFQKLEESLIAYEQVVQAEHGIGLEERSRASPTVPDHSARLRLEILKEMRETASANSKRLLSIQDSGYEASSDSWPRGPAEQLPLFHKEVGRSRWFPTVG